MALRSVIRALVPLGAVLAIAVLCLPLSPAYDLHVFLRAANALLHGRDFYPRVGSPAVYSGSSFVYPSLAVGPFVPLATLPAQLSTALFFVLCAGAVVAACMVGTGGDPWTALLVLGTAFTITGLQLGSLSPLLFAGAVFLWRLRDRPIAFALLAAPVIVSKLFLAPLLLWPLIARRYRAFGLAACFALGLLAAGFVAGPLGLSQYARLLSALGDHEARAGFGMIGVLRNNGLTPGVAQAAALAVAASVCAGAYLHHRRTADERVVFCAGIVASLLVTPVLWSHYLLLLAAALLALGAPRRWFLALALASWAIAPPHGVHLDLPVPERFEPYGPMLGVAASLLVFAYAAIGRGDAARLWPGPRGRH